MTEGYQQELNVCKMVVRPAMIYVLETMALTKRQEMELKMLRFSSCVTRKDEVRKEYTRGTVWVEHFGGIVRGAWLRWFGDVQRRIVDILVKDVEYEAYRQKKKEKEHREDSWMLEMQRVGVTEETTNN